ncbi:MAG: glycosyltransferase [Flavobacteriaceae bacterium]|nr:glycosyltransferase [Flavobacteriaceae bacterium]
MNKRPRILLTIPNFDRAGSGKVVYDLLKGLDKQKFDLEIACRHDRGSFFKEVEALGCRIHLFDTTTPYRPYWNLFSRIKRIRDFFRANQYDIVHSWQWSSDWTEALAARWAGVKWIYTKKAMSWGNIHWKIKSRLASFIININDEMQGYYPQKRAQALIPLGIDTEYYKRAKPLSKNADTSEFKVVMVANLVPVKGAEVLIRAIKALDDSSIKLKILGNKENEYGRRLEQQVDDLEMNHQVEFLGKRPDIRPYVEGADLYVIPTLDMGRKEGMPMSLVEAMSMGVPIIGSDISGINFVLKQFPDLLVKAGDVQALSKKIAYMKALSAESRQAIGESLREFCVNNFRLAYFIRAHEDLYIKLYRS